MAKDGGWEDLFSPLDDDEAMTPLLGEHDSAADRSGLPAGAHDAAPFEATLRGEPEPATDAEPVVTTPAEAPADADVDPLVPADADASGTDAPAESLAPGVAPIAMTGAALTRRELRELRERAALGGDTVVQPPTEPFTPVFAEPSAPEVAEPAAAEAPGSPAAAPPATPAESAPWDPAPELDAEPAAPAPVVADAEPEAAVGDVADAQRPAATPESTPAPSPAAAESPTIPVDYHVMPAAAAAAGGGEPPRQGPGGGFPMPLDPPPPARRRVGLRWLAWFIPVLLVLGGLAYGANYAWENYESQVREVLGMEIPNDYEGTGNGEEVVVTINQGDTGAIIARKLHDAGVTMTWEAFYNLMLELANTGGEPAIQFGNFRLEGEMSARAALNALLDPSRKITNELYLPEGARNFEIFDIISTTLDVPIEEVYAAAADPAVYGAANPVGTLEGYLAPDTYHLDGSEDVATIFQRLVDATFARLDSLGVAPEDRHRILTMASVVQREAGPGAGEAAMVARVFYNRVEQDMLWQSDAAVAYGADNFSSVWNTSAMLDDPDNPFNTYVHKGYPPGPIGAPSMLAIEAAVSPADGPWLFFVTIDLRTGETHFSVDVDEHEAAVDVLRDWCNQSDENASYCR